MRNFIDVQRKQMQTLSNAVFYFCEADKKYEAKFFIRLQMIKKYLLRLKEKKYFTTMQACGPEFIGEHLLMSMVCVVL